MAAGDDIALRILADVSDARRNIEFLRVAFLNAVRLMEEAARRPDFDPASEEARRLAQTVQALGVEFKKAFDVAQKETLGTGKALQSARAEVTRVDQALEKLNKTGGGLRGLTGPLRQIRNGLVSIGAALGVAFGGRQIIEFIKSSIQARVELQALRAQLDAAAGSTEAGGRAYDFARRKALELGFAIQDVVGSQARFEAATRQTNLTLTQRREIFESVIDAGRVLQLSQQRVNNAFLALEQIASKGRVSMEELRRQLGDQIPGALPILAKQLGITTGELIKMVEAGQLMADEALPALAKGLRETFGPGLAKAIETDAAALGRLQVAAFEARAAFAEGFGEQFRGAIDTLTTFINENRESWESLGEGIGSISQIVSDVTSAFSPLGAVLDGLGVETATVADGLELLAKGVKAITSPIKLATQAANDQARAMGLLPEKARSIEDSLKDMRPAVELITAKQREQAEQEKVNAEIAARRVRQIYGKQIPALVELAKAEVDTAEVIRKAKEGDEDAKRALEEIIKKYMERTVAGRAAAKALSEEGIAAGEVKTAHEQVTEALGRSAKAQEEFNQKLFEARGNLFKSREELDKLAGQIITAIDALARFGGANVEQTDKALDFALKVAAGYREMGEALPDDLVERIDRLAESSVSGAEKVVKALKEEAQAYAALGEAIPQDLIDRIAHLEEVTNDHTRAMALSVIGMGEYRKELLGSREEAEVAAAQLAKLVEGFGLLGPVTQEQAEVIKSEVQDLLDAFAEIGEQPPAHLQLLADAMGVTTTRIAEEVEKQQKLLGDLLKAYEAIKTAAPGGEAAKDLATQRKELEALRAKQDEQGTLTLEEVERIGQLEASVDRLSHEVEGLGTAYDQMGDQAVASADQVKAAINGLIRGNAEAFATLPLATQEAVDLILDGLRRSAEEGTATEEVITDAFLKISDRMEEGGVDVGAFQEQLGLAGDEALTVADAVDALGRGTEGAASAMGDLGDATEKAKDKQEEQIEAVEKLKAAHEDLGKTMESTYAAMKQHLREAVALQAQLVTGCADLKACMAGTE
jgi:tape measure domain-containing protein